jgi:hypothetical protein
MIFFSIASWNSGGGGRSTARNKNGELELLISKANGQINDNEER